MNTSTAMVSTFVATAQSYTESVGSAMVPLIIGAAVFVFFFYWIWRIVVSGGIRLAFKKLKGR